MTVFQLISSDANGSEAILRQSPAALLGHAGKVAIINSAGEPQGKIGQQLGRLGYEVIYLREGQPALDTLNVAVVGLNAMILDWRGQNTKDSGFAEQLADEAGKAGLPVLTFVADGRDEDARIARAAGLTNILAMPCRLADLKEALENTIEGREPGTQKPDLRLCDATALLESCRFRFRTPEDVDKLVPLISGIFPDPERTASGIAELMMNAIEHGNLEIGQDRKSDWVSRGIYRSELVKRLQTLPYAQRRAELIINRQENGIMVVIMDEGCGFCWQDFIESDAPEPTLVTGQCGKGLAKAKRDSFDDLKFNHTGNKVTAFVSDETHA